jgi:hypothetical protein
MPSTHILLHHSRIYYELEIYELLYRPRGQRGNSYVILKASNNFQVVLINNRLILSKYDSALANNIFHIRNITLNQTINIHTEMLAY